MSKEIEVNVFQNHIDKGEYMLTDCCAIALALKDTFPNAKDIQVQDVHDMRVDGIRFTAVPKDRSNVDNFITNYDKQIKVSPIKFSIKDLFD